jgi:hypothetical protein
MLGRIIAITIFVLAFCAPPALRGQTPTPSPEVRVSLADAAREAQQNYQAASPQALVEARNELAASVRDVEGWLHRSGALIAAGWKRYLGWSDLENIVAQEGPPAEETARKLLQKLSANHPGLENRRMVRMQQALRNYAVLAVAASNPQVQESHTHNLGALAEHLAAYEQEPASGEHAAAVARGLRWLSQTGQAPSLQTAIRQQLGQPNLHASVSERFASIGMQRQINELTPVRDNILGTDLHGTAHLVGNTSMAFVENPRAATINIIMGGTAWSNNIGYNGPVTIFTNGVTSLSGSKQIQMTSDGLVAYRAGGNARTSSHIRDICARCGLIEKIAWRRAGQQKGQAEAIGSSHAAGRLAGQMDREVGVLVAEQNANYQRRFKQPLARRNALPEALRFSSTSDRAFVEMVQAGDGQLAAPAAPPQRAADHDITVQLHESLPLNFGQDALGGVELTDVRLEALIRDELQTEVPEELQVTLPDGTLDPDKEPWAIVFAKELPLAASFQDGGLRLAIRADGFKRGEGDEPGEYRPALTELVEIAAAYTIEKTDTGATLRRDGDVRIRFPARENPDQITVRDSATVTFMRRKFRSLFKEEFVGEGLKPKGRWAAAGTVPLREITSEGAWLSLGWSLAEANPPAAE